MRPLRVLVTGAPGMLATALRERLGREHLTAMTGHRDLDITDSAAVRAVLSAFRPDTVINCAAMSNVDACERDPETARRINGEAPGLLAALCAEHDAELIHISTDYVFDGTKGSPYVEDDPVQPINHYGESKLRGEEAVASAVARHKILRVSMLYGVARTNFADFVASCIEQGKPVKAVIDNAGSPTHCPDIAEQIAALLGRPETGIFHCAGLGGCSRLEFAEHIRALWPAPGLVIEPVRQADFPHMLAKRPENTSLECRRLREAGILRIKPWRDALADYLTERGRRTRGPH